MNKELFIKTLATKLDASVKEAQKVYDAFEDTFVEGLYKHGKVDLSKFLRAEVKSTSARKGRNIQSGEEIDIPAGKRVGLKPLKRIKEVTCK